MKTFCDVGLPVEDDGKTLGRLEQPSEHGIARERCFSNDSLFSASVHHYGVDDVRKFEQLEATVDRQNLDVDDELMSISERRRSNTRDNSTDNDSTSARFGISTGCFLAFDSWGLSS